jgi:disulfide bond formation protein DsbB
LTTFAQTTDPAQGAQIFKESCAACHGPDARGLPNLGNTLVESELINTATDAEILAQIRQGVDLNNPRNTTGLVMPPSGGRPDLSDAQLLSIVNWIRSQ